MMFGSGKQGLGFVLAGTGILAASFFSLVQWRARRPSTAFTLVSAGKRHKKVRGDTCVYLPLMPPHPCRLALSALLHGTACSSDQLTPFQPDCLTSA